MPAGAALAGMVFCVAGTPSLPDGRLERLIRKHGGDRQEHAPFFLLLLAFSEHAGGDRRATVPV